MSPLELSTRYLEIFFSGTELERLATILHADCQFSGPFFECNTAQQYIASLAAEPPADCSYELLSAMEDNQAAHIFYRFIKPGVETLMSQYFVTRGGKIRKIILVFDSAAFSGDHSE